MKTNRILTLTVAIAAFVVGGTTFGVGRAAPSAAGGKETPEAVLSFDASIVRPASIEVAVTGDRLKDGCTGYHEVVTGAPYLLTVTTSPASSGTLEVIIERRTGGVSWEPFAVQQLPLVDGAATLPLVAGSDGLYRISALLAEEPIGGSAATVYVAHVTPDWHRYADGGLRLQVPWYQQQHRLSCEAATLRMAHNFFEPGSIDRDTQVLKIVGVDGRLPKGNRWGNPNKEFVGSPNGYTMSTGYGVHYGPIASAATQIAPCRPAITLKDPSHGTIARYVAGGFPVIVWGAHAGRSGIYKKSWTAWDGSSVTAWSVEHVWLVVGFHGPASKPTSFIVHDPSGSAQATVSLGRFDEFTKYFRHAVVVRG